MYLNLIEAYQLARKNGMFQIVYSHV